MTDQTCLACGQPKGPLQEVCPSCGAHDPRVLTVSRGQIGGGPSDAQLADAIADDVRTLIGSLAPPRQQLVDVISAAIGRVRTAKRP